MTDESALVEMHGIEKRFGRIIALNGVDFSLEENEVHTLAGDNGSGKSTLIKGLVGVHQPDSGEIYIRGNKVDIESPKQAREYGISTVYQDLALVDSQTVAENMFMSRYPMKKIAGILSILDRKKMRDEARSIIRERLNLEIDPTTNVEFLSGGERQAVAIARALVTDPDIIVMDEPTAALSPDSAERVRDLIRTLRNEGVSVFLISHDLENDLSMSDRVTVLYNGNSVGTVDGDNLSKDDAVHMMVAGSIPT